MIISKPTSLFTTEQYVCTKISVDIKKYGNGHTSYVCHGGTIFCICYVLYFVLLSSMSDINMTLFYLWTLYHNTHFVLGHVITYLYSTLFIRTKLFWFRIACSYYFSILSFKLFLFGSYFFERKKINLLSSSISSNFLGVIFLETKLLLYSISLLFLFHNVRNKYKNTIIICLLFGMYLAFTFVFWATNV